MGPSPFPTWASKPGFEQILLRSRAYGALLGWLAFFGSACQGQYTEAPTACDDHCLAIQRADCAEDYPADCVRDCEQEGAAATCESAWRTLDDCYGAASASAFSCVDDHSRPHDVCLAERRALSECLAPGSGACFDECVRQVASCGATLNDCEASCHAPAPGCEAASHDYNSCLLDYPPECRGWFEPDPRPAAEIPCLKEVGAVLSCGK